MQMMAAALLMVLLNPVRLYFQPNQPVMVRLDIQAMAQINAGHPQPLKLALLGEQGHLFATATLPAGATEVDLAKAFPNRGKGQAHLWDGQTYLVQLVAGDTPIGSPLVVVPLKPPGRAEVASPNGLRIYPEKLIEFQTTLGSIGIRLDPEAAPNTTNLFSQLVAGGFYTQVIFHRVIPDFVIQGGDPTGSGTGGPGFFIDLEPSSKRHGRGTVSMARQGNDINTSGSQFFICLSREGCAALDEKYTAFGDVVWGMDVVDKIVALPTVAGGANRPVNPPAIVQALLLPAPPRPIDAAPPAQLPAPKVEASATN